MKFSYSDLFLNNITDNNNKHKSWIFWWCLHELLFVQFGISIATSSNFINWHSHAYFGGLEQRICNQSIVGIEDLLLFNIGLSIPRQHANWWSSSWSLIQAFSCQTCMASHQPNKFPADTQGGLCFFGFCIW